MALKTRRKAAEEARRLNDASDGESTPAADQNEPATPPTNQSPSRSPSPNPSSPPNHASEDKSTSGGRARGVATWKPWEDEALAFEVHASQPWTATKADGGKARAWDAIALKLAKAHDGFKREGTACKTHFEKLLKKHEKGELKAKRASGEGGTVSNFTRIMTDIETLLKDAEGLKTATSESVKVKLNLEQAAGEAIRAAAMRNLVKRETMPDVTQLEGSSAREKSGQRPSNKRHNSNSSSAGESEHKPRKRLNVRKELKAFIETRQAADDKVLEEARTLQETQHQETTRALEAVSEAIQGLAQSIADDRRARQSEQSVLVSVIERIAKPSN